MHRDLVMFAVVTVLGIQTVLWLVYVILRHLVELEHVRVMRGGSVKAIGEGS